MIPELNKIYQGDCLEIMRGWPDKFFDLILTDPPYGIAKKWVGGFGHGWERAREHQETRNRWDDSPPSDETFKEIFRISKNQIIWGGNYFKLPVSRCWYIWNKPERGFTLAEAEMAWTSKDSIVRVCDCHRSDHEREHPTQKPLMLMKWCLNQFPDAKTVCDPFAGSGTTLVASEETNRYWVGIEREPKYCAIAQARIDAERAQGKLF